VKGKGGGGGVGGDVGGLGGEGACPHSGEDGDQRKLGSFLRGGAQSLTIHCPSCP